MSSLLLGAAVGATGAFILDPQNGPRRQALVRDKLERGREVGRAAAKDWRGGVGAALVLYALARGGFGALVPLALGAGLVACALSASSRRSLP